MAKQTESVAIIKKPPFTLIQLACVVSYILLPGNGKNRIRSGNLPEHAFGNMNLESSTRAGFSRLFDGHTGH